MTYWTILWITVIGGPLNIICIFGLLYAGFMLGLGMGWVQ